MPGNFSGGSFSGHVGGFSVDGGVTPTFDTHDGADERKHDEEFRRRDEEIREARQRLRDQLREVVFGVTRKPPPLEASAKELAAIARKSESFDYQAALREISRIEGEAKELAADRERRSRNAEDERRRRLRRQEEEAIVLLLLH